MAVLDGRARPSALSQSAVINADAVSLAVVALSAAYALRLAASDEPLRHRQIAIVVILGSCSA